MRTPEINTYLEAREDIQFTALFNLEIASLFEDPRFLQLKLPFIHAEILIRLALAEMAGYRINIFGEIMPNCEEAVLSVANALRGNSLLSDSSCPVDFDHAYLRSRINNFLEADGTFPVVDTVTGEAMLIPFKIRRGDEYRNGGCLRNCSGKVTPWENHQFNTITGWYKTEVELLVEIDPEEIDGKSFEFAVLLAWIVKSSCMKPTVPRWMLSGTGAISPGYLEAAYLDEKLVAAEACKSGVFFIPSEIAKSHPWCCSVSFGGSYDRLVDQVEITLIERGMVRCENQVLPDANTDVLPITASIMDGIEGLGLSHSYEEEYAADQISSLFESVGTVILSGNSGSGKSTFLRSVLSCLENKPITGTGLLSTPLVPYFIPASDLAASGESIRKRIESNYLHQSLTHLLSTRLLIIIDGLDGEDESEDKIASQIIQLAREFPFLRFLISTRHPSFVSNRLASNRFIHLQMDLLDSRTVESALDSRRSDSLLGTVGSLCRHPFYFQIVKSLVGNGKVSDMIDTFSPYRIMERYFKPNVNASNPRDAAILQSQIMALSKLADSAVAAVDSGFSMIINPPPSQEVILYAGNGSAGDLLRSGRRVLITRHSSLGEPICEFTHSLFRDFLWVYQHIVGATNHGDKDGGLMSDIKNKVIGVIDKILSQSNGSKEYDNRSIEEDARKHLEPWTDILVFSVSANPQILKEILPILKRIDLEFASRLVLLEPLHEDFRMYVGELCDRCRRLVQPDVHPYLRSVALKTLGQIGAKDELMEILDGSQGLFIQAASERRQVISEAIEHGHWDLVYFCVKQSILGRSQPGTVDDATFAASGQGISEGLFRHLLILCRRKNALIRLGRNSETLESVNQWVGVFRLWLSRISRNSRRRTMLDGDLRACIPLAAILLADHEYHRSNDLEYWDFGWDNLTGLLPSSFWKDVLRSLMQFSWGLRPSIRDWPLRGLISDAFECTAIEDMSGLIRAAYLYEVSGGECSRPDEIWSSRYSHIANDAGVPGWEQAWILEETATVWSSTVTGLKGLIELIQKHTSRVASHQEAKLLGIAMNRATNFELRRKIGRRWLECMNYSFLNNWKRPELQGNFGIWLVVIGADDCFTRNDLSELNDGLEFSWFDIDRCVKLLFEIPRIVSGKRLRAIKELKRVANLCQDLLSQGRIIRNEGIFFTIKEGIIIAARDGSETVLAILDSWRELDFEKDSDRRRDCAKAIGLAAVSLGKVLLLLGDYEMAVRLRMQLMKSGWTDFGRYSRAMLEDVLVHTSLDKTSAEETPQLIPAQISKFSPRMQLGLWGTVFLKRQAASGRNLKTDDRLLYVDGVWRIFEESRRQISESDFETERILFEISLKSQSQRPTLLQMVYDYSERDDWSDSVSWSRGIRFAWFMQSRLSAVGEQELLEMILKSPSVSRSRDEVWGRIAADLGNPRLGEYCEPALGFLAAANTEESDTVFEWFTDKVLAIDPDASQIHNFGRVKEGVATVLKAIFELILCPLGPSEASRWIETLSLRIHREFLLTTVMGLARVSIKFARTSDSGDEFNAWVNMAEKIVEMIPPEEHTSEVSALKVRVDALRKWKDGKELVVPEILNESKQTIGRSNSNAAMNCAFELEESVVDGILIHLRALDPKVCLSTDDFSNILRWTRHARKKVFRILAREVVDHFKPSVLTRDLLGVLLTYLPTHLHSSISILAANIAFAPDEDSEALDDLALMLCSSQSDFEDSETD